MHIFQYGLDKITGDRYIYLQFWNLISFHLLEKKKN